MIAIIGAGLSGLTAARELLMSGFDDFLIFEQGSEIGGRIRTHVVDGFLIDKGFQVLNPEYRILDHYISSENLELGFFDSGAMLLGRGGESLVFRDPLEAPEAIKDMFFGSNQLPLRDLLAAGWLKFKSLLAAEEPCFDTKTDYQLSEFLETGFFREEFLNRFLKPFFAGVLLSKDFDVPYSYFEYLFSLFAKSSVGLPKEGMKKLVELLAEPIPNSKFRFESSVEKYEDGCVIFSDGILQKIDSVILATDSVATAKILGDSIDLVVQQREVLTAYFSTPIPPWSENLLGLLPWGSGPVNHISIQSHAQPSYSPSSESLLSVNIIDPEFMSMSDEELTQRVKTSLKPFEIKALDSWKLIAQTPVPKALPSKFACGKQNIDQNGVFVAGDFLETPSIGGAMLSGKRAAERFLDSLSH